MSQRTSDSSFPGVISIQAIKTAPKNFKKIKKLGVPKKFGGSKKVVGTPKFFGTPKKFLRIFWNAQNFWIHRFPVWYASRQSKQLLAVETTI